MWMQLLSTWLEGNKYKVEIIRSDTKEPIMFVGYHYTRDDYTRQQMHDDLLAGLEGVVKFARETRN